MKHAKFGDCLNGLLQLRGWSAARLAKAINIDSSYVRRWVRGERTPSLNSNYIIEIAGALNEGLEKEYKKVTKDAFLKGLETLTGSEDKSEVGAQTIYERLVHILKQSQIHSLTLDQEARKTHKPIERQSYVVDLLENVQRQAPSRISSDNLALSAFVGGQIPQAIQGRKEVLSAAISMIREAMADTEFVGNREVFLTFQSEREYFDDYPEIYTHWQNTIIEALNVGWDIKQICKLNKNVERSLRLVNQIMDWTNYLGTYGLFYFNKYGIYNPPFEIFLVRGKGALLCFATENHNEIDAAIYINELESVQIIENFAKQMFYDVEPLVRKLDLEEYFELNAAKDRKSGNHLICYHELNFLTVPYETMKKYVQISIPDEDENKVHMKRIDASYESFGRDIQKYKMCHIYPMRIFEHVVQTGKYPKNGYFRPTTEDITHHIKHIIWLLKTHSGFEIALVSDNQMDLLNQAEWEIKGDHTITIGVMPKNENDTNVELLTITEGTILGAFQEYFWDIWDRINPIHRDKYFVISWLERLLRTQV
ncbi:transcriptional regulator with XRE-family HTH domain [Paenibacillus anaericanus]|uniref:helix-turn-helix domain-containing protein n=1 Tax=Paenibacillus anaericanus TaxID=170367 RepID=UPI0027835856|nr:helix-turn-helix transcriptional regulator [Paenibacillus anaericanus]MDQ0090984.1 transcriptional regulator with XRE-family HTH domain [Paenibacillus anaericanus]